MLAADHMYSSHIWGKYQQMSKVCFIKKPEPIFHKIYWKIPKNVVGWMHETFSFRTIFRSQRVHGSQALLNSAGHNLYANFPVIQNILSQKTSPLIRSKILGVFGNRFACDHMYSRHNLRKLPQHVKTPLSQKGETYFRIFIAFLQSIQSFPHFEKKRQLYSLNSWEVIDSEKCGYFNARKLLFQNTLWESKCWREPNTPQICLAARFSWFSSNARHI